MIARRRVQVPADKGIRPELLRETTLPWRPNSSPASVAQLALWSCPAAGGVWTLTPDASLIWRRPGDRSTATLDMTLTSSTDRVVRRLVSGKPWRTTTTALGAVGWKTVSTAPGLPVEITRELLPLTQLPENAVPPGMPSLVVRFAFRNRSTKPLDIELTVRTAAPGTSFHRTVGVAIRTIPGGQRIRLRIAPGATADAVILCGPPGRGAQPHPDPLGVARATNRLLDETTLPGWLVNALVRASATLSTSDQLRSIHTVTRPPGDTTDPVDALPLILALRRRQPKLAPTPLCARWVQRLQTRLEKGPSPDTVEDHLRLLLAISSARALASESNGVPTDRVDTLRRSADRARERFRATFAVNHWPSDRSETSPCRPVDLAMLADFVALDLESPVDPHTERRWLEAVWNHCLVPDRTTPAGGGATRFSLTNAGWLRSARPGSGVSDPEWETDPIVLWRLTSVYVARGTVDSGLIAGTVAAGAPVATGTLAAIYDMVRALGGIQHDTTSETVTFAPPGNNDLARVPFTVADGFGIATQSVDSAGQRWTLEMGAGRLPVRTLRLRTSQSGKPSGVLALLGRTQLPVEMSVTDKQLTLTFSEPVRIEPGRRLYVSILF